MGGPHRAAESGGLEAACAGDRRPAVFLSAGLFVAERPRAAAPPPRACGQNEHEYPPGLLDLADAPARLWLRGGAVPDRTECVALVGSRAASPYGAGMARRLAADLAGLGLTVVSGLARGIDAAAHRGALAAGGHTVAVVPSGLDRVTPPEHGALAEEIARRGTLLSEVEAGGPFGRGAFVKRNRLIAALSSVTVVVEAAERSGALSTAAAARALGLPVLAVPGDVDRPTARGCLELLRGGARVCGDAGDIAALAGRTSPRTGARTSGLAAALDAEPRTLDDLADRAGAAPGEVLAALLRLEWAGVAIPCPGQRWKARS